MIQIIPGRNFQSLMVPMLQSLHTAAEEEGEDLVFHDPVIFTVHRPTERLVFFPGFRRNPAQELGQAFASLAQAEGSIEDAAKAVTDGGGHFLFSTPQLVVRGSVGGDGRFNLTAVLADTNPFQGVLGQMGLQMSILHELMAQAAHKHVGTLTIQQMGLRVPLSVVTQLMRAALDQHPEDPYEAGLKPRKLDGPLQMKMAVEEGPSASGYSSKWVRHVALPLLATLKAEDLDEARKLAEGIKADDWRRSCLEWLDAMGQAQAYQKMMEAKQQAEGNGEA